MQNMLEISGKFIIELYDKDNVLKQRIVKHNRVVDTGLAQIASLVAGPTNDGDAYITIPTHMGIGAVGDAVVAQDATLRHEIYRNEFDSVKRTDNAVEYKTTFKPAQPDIDTCRVEEIALFNAPSEGCMLNRCVFQPIYKGKDDTIIVTYVIEFLALESTYDRKHEDMTNEIN